MKKQPNRLSLALDFACVAIIVMLSGHVADQVLKNGKAWSPKRDIKRAARNPLFTLFEKGDFKNGSKYCGVLKRVAHDLGVCPITVSNVRQGYSRSARIENAIIKEINRIDALPDVCPPILTAPELTNFQRGKKYFSLYAITARNLEIAKNHLVNSVRSGRRSPRILSALRAEMARVDAELAAKKAGAQ
jgi:hypothetical protein